MKLTQITATDIPDAWFQCVNSVLDTGRRYEIHHGSYVGQTRLEFDYITVLINRPYAEPYDMMLPVIPPHHGLPNPVENGYIEQYLPYLLTEHREPGEKYTYGSRIHSQVLHWIEALKKSPNTNQAILQVGHPEDFLIDDPPCLRHIDVRVKDDQLIFFPYFRSWDLWGGFPANLAAIAVLQKYMADEIGVCSGPIVCVSKGLHIYGYVEDIAKIRTGK